MANPRVYAGFYKRYDEKIVYVISTAKDTDTGEETVIFFNYDYFTAISYFLIIKAFVVQFEKAILTVMKLVNALFKLPVIICHMP